MNSTENQTLTQQFLSRHDVVQTLDAIGLRCPMPLLKAKQALNGLTSGAILHVIATDSGSVRDFKVFLDMSPHTLIEHWNPDSEYHYLIEKGE